ncbi:MAG: FapA family protein [Treponema sp.]|jgi:uncharacterized protein (DUF342 family)|nr:FapA family protein [Treponema sp.]
MAEPAKNENKPNRSMIMAEKKNDGNMVVAFSENDIEVRADFIPPIGTGAIITEQYTTALLERFNIVYGVYQEVLADTVRQCNLERKIIKDVVIARGDAPEEEVPEYFELNSILSEPVPYLTEKQDELRQIDYRAISPFVIVKEGQILASLHPYKPGKEGKNVHGIAVPFQVIQPVGGVIGGSNTQTGEKFITSRINGQFIQKGSEISVQESLVINGPVGYATGNIIYPGDVIIDGPVSDGFKIVSGGSVTIKQTFDVTNVITKGDLVVTGGIIGRGVALIKVGGDIKTKFIQNSRVACRKNVIVDTEVVNSSIYAMGSLDLGDKGMVLGGDIYAINGVRAGNIGKKAGKSTAIHCGIDFTIQQEKEKCNNQLRILTAKLGKVREIMDQPELDAEKRVRMDELLHRLEDEQKKIAARITALLGKPNDNEKAVVEVSGEICPGTLIEICQVALFVTEPLRKVRIQLDVPTGKLIHTPL